MAPKQPDLGLRLRAALHERRITAAQLARTVGVTPQAVNGWLTRGAIRKEYALVVAKILGLSAEELLSGDDVATPPALDEAETELVRL